MSTSSASVDTVTAVMAWLIILSLFNLDDDVARLMGEFAQNVVAGFNGGS